MGYDERKTKAPAQQLAFAEQLQKWPLPHWHLDVNDQISDLQKGILEAAREFSLPSPRKQGSLVFVSRASSSSPCAGAFVKDGGSEWQDKPNCTLTLPPILQWGLK